MFGRQNVFYIKPKELKHEAEADLEGVAVAMIKDALAVMKIMLPLDAQVGGVVKVPVKCGPSRECLRAIIFIMKIGFPEDGAIGTKGLKVVAQVDGCMALKRFTTIINPATGTQMKMELLI